MKKEIVYLTESDVLYGANNYIKNRLCVDKKDIENGYISDLWYDCDHVKTFGESGRGDARFVTVENKSKLYVITPYELDSESHDILEWWINGAKNEIQINNDWNDWDKVQEGIAYRGGAGYTYALYCKTLKTN